MSSTTAFTTPPGGLAGLLDRERTVAGGSYGIGKGGVTPGALLAWAAFGIPIAHGVWITLSKSLILFGL